MYSSEPVVLTAAELESLETKLIPASREFGSPQGRHLDARGFKPKAGRYEDCGSYWRLEHCGDTGHVQKENTSRCGLEYMCKPCGDVSERANLYKYSPLIHAIETPQFFSFEIFYPLDDHSGETSKAVHRAMLRWSAPLLDRIGYREGNGVTPGRVVTKAIYFGELAGQDILQLRNDLPSTCYLSYSRMAKARFDEALRSLVKFEAPSDPETQANMEIAFDHVRRMHLSGVTHKKLDVYRTLTDNFPPTPSITLTSPNRHCVECGEHLLVRVNRCRICGKPAIYVSKWLWRGERIDPKNIEWKQIALSPP